MRHGKVDTRLPEKRKSKSRGARPVHKIISIIRWIRTSRLSIKNSLVEAWGTPRERALPKAPLSQAPSPKGFHRALGIVLL